MDPIFYGFLAAVMLGYCLLLQVVKFCYIKTFHSWL